MSGTHVLSGDILLNITGASIGRSAIVPNSFDEGNVSQHVAIVRTVSTEIKSFLHLLIISPYVQKLIDQVQVGISREGLSMARLKHFIIPLPPLAEQRRIVARVDALLALCDTLEARLREERMAAAHLAEGLCAAVVAGVGVTTRVEERRAEQAVILELPQHSPGFDLDAYAIFVAYVVQQHLTSKHTKRLGLVKLEKIVHLAEPYAQIDFGRKPQALSRGPADFALQSQAIARGQALNAFVQFERETADFGYCFEALPELDALADHLDATFGDHAIRLRQLVELLLPERTRSAEAIATLYAVWNDLLRAGEAPDDTRLFAAFQAFHPTKEHFSATTLQRWLDWMRTHGLVPDGSAKVTLAARTQPASPAPINLAAVRQQNTRVRRAAETPVAYATDEGYAAAVALLSERGSLSNGELQAAMGLDGAMARTVLQQLVTAGLARVEGQRRTTRYVRVGEQGN